LTKIIKIAKRWHRDFLVELNFLHD